MNQRAVVRICAKKCAVRFRVCTQVVPFQVSPLGQVCVPPDGGEVVVVDVTHAVPLQYCPLGQVVPPPEVPPVLDVTHALPLQYCPVGHVVVDGVEPQSAGQVALVSPLPQKLLPQVSAPDATQDVPFQYCPLAQVAVPAPDVVVEVTHAVPLQYCPDGQVVAVAPPVVVVLPERCWHTVFV